MENNKMSAEDFLNRKLESEPNRRLTSDLLISYLEEYASQQTTSLQKQIEERDKEIERLKLFEKLNENKRALMNNMEEDYKELEEDVERLKTELTLISNTNVSLLSQLSQKDEMMERMAKKLGEWHFLLLVNNIDSSKELVNNRQEIKELLTEYQNSKK